jgi:hypothetical protein
LPWIQAGRVRVDFAPTFWTWDSRYGLGPAGEEAVEELGLDLTATGFGSPALPDLLDLEASLAEALGDPSYKVNLGVSQAVIDQSLLVFPFRLDIGVTDWLTVGAMAPLVRPRTELLFVLDGDSITATDGISPFSADPSSVLSFLNAFRGVLQSARASIPGDPAVAEAQAYFEALTAAYSHGTFFPAQGSGPAARLQERLDEVRTALSDLGFPGIPETVPLAAGFLNEEGFQEFLTGPMMRSQPLEDFTTLWALGDVEITANVRLLKRGFEPDSAGTLPPLRFQVGVGALVRLGTGGQADPTRFYDQDHGDGQMDLEGSVFGLVELGTRFGAWGRMRYGIQNEGEVFRRITDPDGVLPGYTRLAPLKWTPGDYFELDLNPRIYLTPDMSFGVRYHLWSKGEDSYSLGEIVTPEGQEPRELPPPSLLNLETEEKLQEAGFSATYSSVDAHARGEASLPLYVRATYFHPVGGSGGQTPKGGRFQVGLTIFKTFWGGRSSTEELPGMLSGGR